MVGGEVTRFGELLRHHRLAAGLTQAELAAALGLSDEERAAFEVAAHPPAGSSPDLPTDTPTLTPVERRPHKLPIPPTPCWAARAT